MTDKLELGRAKLIHEFGSGPLRCLIANNIFFIFVASEIFWKLSSPRRGSTFRRWMIQSIADDVSLIVPKNPFFLTVFDATIQESNWRRLHFCQAHFNKLPLLSLPISYFGTLKYENIRTENTHTDNFRYVTPGQCFVLDELFGTLLRNLLRNL